MMMNCKNCGQPLLMDDKVCKNCGTVVNNTMEPIKPVVNNGPVEPVIEKENLNQEIKPVTMPGLTPKVEVKPTPSISEASINQEIKPVTMPSLTPKEDKPVIKTESSVSEPIKPLINNKVSSVNNKELRPVTMPGMDSNNVLIKKEETKVEVKEEPKVEVKTNDVSMPVEVKNEPKGEEVVEEKKKKVNPIIILLLLVVLGVGGYFGVKALLDSDILSGSTKKKAVEYSGYSFQVNEDYTTKNYADSLLIYDKDAIITLAFVNGSYDEIDTTKVLEKFNTASQKTTYEGEKEKDGQKYHLFKTTISGKDTYLGYLASGTSKVICFCIEGKDTKTLPKASYIDEALEIAKTATYNGSSSIKTDVVNEETNISVAVDALSDEEESTGDINEDVYEDIYVNIMLEEINE